MHLTGFLPYWKSPTLNFQFPDFWPNRNWIGMDWMIHHLRFTVLIVRPQMYGSVMEMSIFLRKRLGSWHVTLGYSSISKNSGTLIVFQYRNVINYRTWAKWESVVFQALILMHFWTIEACESRCKFLPPSTNGKRQNKTTTIILGFRVKNIFNPIALLQWAEVLTHEPILIITYV